MLETNPSGVFAVKSLFRHISRHVRYLKNSELSQDLKFLKAQMRSCSPVAPLRQRRQNILTLFNINKDLQSVEDEKLSIAQAREHWGVGIRASNSIERNQGGRVQAWQQHEARRFDKYNTMPNRNSPKFAEIDRRAKFSDNAARFAKIFGCQKESIAVRTIFAPYWKLSSQTKDAQIRPRPVEVRSIRRESGNLSLLRVRGIKMRAVGIRRHINEVDKKRFARIADLEFQKWLAMRYSEDLLDGEEMEEWIRLLSAEIRNQKHAQYQAVMRFEVQRRILLRRRAELERDWDWRFRFKVQEQERLNGSNPKPLLTLSKL